MYNEIFLYGLTSIVTVFVTNFIYYDFFKNRYEKKLSTFYYVIYLLAATGIVVIVNWFGNVVLNYCINILQFILLSLMFKFNTKKDIIINFSFLLFLALLDIVLFIAIDTGINYFGSTINKNLGRTMIEMILESLVYFIAYCFIKSFLLQQKYVNLRRKDILIYVCVSMFSWLICFGLAVFSMYYQDSYFYSFSFLVTILILIFNVIFVSVEETVSKKYELESEIFEINQKAELNMEYYKKLEDKDNQNSLLLHDIKNHLQMLRGMIDSSSGDDPVNSYFKKINRVLDLNNKCFFSDNKVLEILINDKIDLAMKHGIKVNVKYDDTDLSFISEFDLVTILANMFDNAIDAAVETSFSEKSIDCIIKKVQSYLIIKMNNPYKKIIRENNIFKTTKNNHLGLGLKSIKNSLDKYNATYNVDTSVENLFKLTVIIPL